MSESGIHDLSRILRTMLDATGISPRRYAVREGRFEGRSLHPAAAGRAGFIELDHLVIYPSGVASLGEVHQGWAIDAVPGSTQQRHLFADDSDEVAAREAIMLLVTARLDELSAGG